MPQLIMQYQITVSNTKYRELLNMIEKELSRPIPFGCSKRDVLQSLDDIHSFTYSLHWNSPSSLTDYLESTDYKAFKGGLNVLSSDIEFSVFEPKEVSTLLNN